MAKPSGRDKVHIIVDRETASVLKAFAGAFDTSIGEQASRFVALAEGRLSDDERAIVRTARARTAPA